MGIKTANALVKRVDENGSNYKNDVSIHCT